MMFKKSDGVDGAQWQLGKLIKLKLSLSNMYYKESVNEQDDEDVHNEESAC